MMSGEEHPTDLLSRPRRRRHRDCGGFEVDGGFDDDDDDDDNEASSSGQEEERADGEDDAEEAGDDDLCRDPGESVGDASGDGGGRVSLGMPMARGGRRTMRKRRRTRMDVDAGGGDGGDPDDLGSSKRERASKRRRSEGEGDQPAAAAATEPPPLTELDAAFHMFSDAVDDYVSSRSRGGDEDDDTEERKTNLSGGERDFLLTLRDLVSRDVDARNEIIHENRALVARKRAAETEVSDLRHRVLAARERAREVRRECAALEGEVARSRREEEDLDGANRFLWALTGLARQSSSESESATGPRCR